MIEMQLLYVIILVGVVLLAGWFLNRRFKLLESDKYNELLVKYMEIFYKCLKEIVTELHHTHVEGFKNNSPDNKLTEENIIFLTKRVIEKIKTRIPREVYRFMKSEIPDFENWVLDMVVNIVERLKVVEIKTSEGIVIQHNDKIYTA